MSSKQEIIDKALSSLEFFIKLIHPNRVLGHVHIDLCQWSTRQDAKTHQLVLLPRDHQKSAMAAYRVAWEITKNPAIRILYISATSNLAQKQLKFIQDILTSDVYRFYWPDMVNQEEGKREKWTATEFCVDHPKRKQELVRDPTVFTAGLTTVIVGMHCDIAVLDDVVIDDTADTEGGRNQVRTQVSYLASVCGTDSQVWAYGTRYHPKDLYQDFLNTMLEVFNEDGEIVDVEALWEVYERQVETAGDGSGEFLWPRMQRYDGKWFGFNREILARKKAGYYDLTKFRAQYYNNPNDVGSASVKRENFNYFDRGLIRRDGGKWYYKGRALNLFAAVDFAYSVSKEADFTAIVVIGIDKDQNIYVLDIERFKTKKISDYFDKIISLHTKWGFRKIRAETTAAQDVIVEDLKNNYIKPNGIILTIDGVRPTKKKEERVEAILQHRYANGLVWHYRGGNCEILEEELTLQKPPHDDVKDALASAVEIAVPPSFMNMGHSSNERVSLSAQHTHKRFGGIN